ncbi:MAG TPA: hypothetical protein EYN51_01980 [Flavobacteriales bacterium]|nr:hypothetical protein [Flavobacteriales bacterium]
MGDSVNASYTQVDGKLVENPDENEKVQFVVANLLNAIKGDNAGLTSALCTYIADGMPDLKQIKIDEANGEVSIDFVFDEDYKGQAAVEFTVH